MTTNFDTADLYRSQRSPYYIVAPDYHEGSSGIRVLHYLCHILNQKGNEAYIHGGKVSDALWTPKLDDEIMYKHYLASRKPIVVYPEVVSGTPLALGIKVRYMLNKPGFISGDQNYDEDEIFFAYQEAFLPAAAPKNILCIPATDPNKFNPEGTTQDNRYGRYFYYNRLLDRGGQLLPLTKDAIEISPANHRSLDELAEIFRHAELLYCYEASSIATEARLCGCPVVYVPNETMLNEFPSNRLGDEGTAWGESEDGLARAKATVHQIFQKYMKLYDEFLSQLDKFITLTQQKANDSDFETCYPLETIYAKGWIAPQFLGSNTRNLSRPSPKSSRPFIALNQKFAQWIAKRNPLQTDLELIEQTLQDPTQNLASFHIITTCLASAENLLADTLDSLGQQLFPNWHFDIITTLPTLDGLGEIPCIGWHIVESLDKAKEIIDFQANTYVSDWLIEIPVGAKLDPLFLWRLSRETSLSHKINTFFVDDDCHDDAGKHYQPRFKPGVNPAALLSSDLAGPLCVRREAWLETGGTSQRQGSPWFSKLLEITDKYGWNSVQHIPDVLISYPGTFPSHPESCLLALHDNMKNKSEAAEFLPATGQSWCIRYPLAATPSVTIAILSEGQLDLLSRCLTSIIEKTRYPGFEIIIALTATQLDLDLQSELTQLEQLPSINIRTISTDAAGNLATRCNAAVKAASNDFVLLINEGAVVIQDNWLEELIRTCLQADIAAVSPRMIAPGTGLIENAGNVIGLSGPVGSPYQAEAKIQDFGYLDCLQIARDVSALSANCILIRVEDYAAVGGMDEVDLGDHLADADLCQKLLSRGKRLIYQPLSTVVDGHCSTVDLKINDECKAKSISAQAHATKTFSLRWLKSAEIDRFWNPNLSLGKSIPVPETDFRALWQYLPTDTPRILARPLPNAQGAFRVTAPLNALRQAGLASECIWPISESSRELTASELMRLSPDTLIVQHYLHDKHLAALEAWHSLPNRPLTVYAIDDLLTNMAESNHCHRNIPVNSRSRLQYALSRCDRMVASTDFLAEAYRHFIPDIRVVPNRLSQEVWLPLESRKRTANKPRIGWAGSATHQGDLVLLKEIIEQTRDEADWIFFGMCPNDIRPLLFEYHPFTPFQDYPAHLAALNLDIAVAPLAEIPFNQGKSNLRLLEYGVLGIPVVCTDIDPYRPSPACCVENTPQAWVAALRERIHNADARELEGATMRSWVRQHYLLEDYLDEWLQAHLPS